MRNLLIAVLMFAVASTAVSQNKRGQGEFNRFIPITLSAGTAMTARTDAAALDDTTQSLDIRGYGNVALALVVATNDSASALVSWRGSVTGSSWSAFSVIDSISTTGTVGISKAFALPDRAFAYDYIQFRVYGSQSAVHSANPSSTITTYVTKRH